MLAVGDIKKCSRCREEKEISEYGSNKKLGDGLNCYCKACAREIDRNFRSNLVAECGLLSQDKFKTKFCPGCSTYLSSADFSRDKHKSGGLSSYCKACRIKRGQTEIARAQKRLYNSSDRGRANRRLWKICNKERVKALNKKWRDANPDKCRRMRQEWRLNNRERARHHTAVREKRVSGRGSYTYNQWVELCEVFDNKCAYCFRGCKLTRHHVVPIAAGGSNLIANIIPARIRCNCHIHTKIILPIGMLTMEDQFVKKGVIEPGITPPENSDCKSASDLEECVSKRLSESVKAKITSEVESK